MDFSMNYIHADISCFEALQNNANGCMATGMSCFNSEASGCVNSFVVKDSSASVWNAASAGQIEAEMKNALI